MVLPDFFTTIFNTVFSVQGFFRLANFGVFIALGVYLYHGYIKDFVSNQMKAEEAVFEGLAVERRDAMLMHEKYAQQVARAAQNQARMQNMIFAWHAAVEGKRAVEALENRSLLLARKQKAKLLAEHLRKKVIAQRVMPEALSAARQELQKIFSQDQEGARMVQGIMAYIASHTPNNRSGTGEDKS